MSDLEEAAREPIPATEGEEAMPPVAEDSQQATESDNVPPQDEPEKDESDGDEPKLSNRRRRSMSHRELVTMNERLLALLEQQRPAQHQPQPAAGGEPKRDDFEDYEAFLEARADWRAEQTVARRLAEREEAERAERNAAAQAETNQRWTTSHEAAIDRYDDYEDIYEIVGTSIDAEQAGAIRSADAPAEVVYFLGKNPKEFAKFKSLTGAAAVKAVGRIEERISQQRDQKSRAPAPVRPVRGAAPSSNALSDDLPIDEWVKRRNREVYGS